MLILKLCIMAKELPYFKFESAEWLTGRIAFQPLEVQGAFINVCCVYWQKLGVLTKRDIEYRIGKELLQTLISLDFIEENQDFLNIGFLDEQLIEIQDQTKKKSELGTIGNLKRWHKDVYKKYDSGKISLDEAIEIANRSQPDRETSQIRREENRIDKNRIEERKDEFYKLCTKHIEDYSNEMIQNFFEYWSEHGEKDKKMRYEKQTSFSIERRLKTWSKNEKKFNSNNGYDPTQTIAV